MRECCRPREIAWPPPLQGLTMVGHAKRQMRADAEGGAADGGADEHLVTA